MAINYVPLIYGLYVTGSCLPFKFLTERVGREANVEGNKGTGKRTEAAVLSLFILFSPMKKLYVDETRHGAAG